MMQKLNLQLKEDSSQHSFLLLMEEITLASAKTAVEWIFEANFAEERPELLNLIITSPGGDCFSRTYDFYRWRKRQSYSYTKH
jgi:ATP-dependent protease ClpP protease subunit